MAQGYFGKGHFTEDYWNDDYWAPTGAASDVGDYWSINFFADDYWNDNYWRISNTGDVFQDNSPNLSLTTYSPQVFVGLTVQASTPALPLTAYQASVANDIAPAITTPNVALTPFTASIGLGGYQLGDIPLRWVPESTITVTYGNFVDTEALPLQAFGATVDAGDITVNVGNTPNLPAATFVTDVSNDISVFPNAPNLSFSAFQALAGQGTNISVSLATLPLIAPTHGIVGQPEDADVFPTARSLSLASYRALVTGIVEVRQKPPSTFGDYGALIINNDAIEVLSNYEICARTGFRQLPGTLVKDGYGELVRGSSRDSKHPQDFVRSRPDKLEGSKRPEQTDRFIGVDTPAVSASDL